jgi:GntR family transcriptional regulator
MSSHPIAPDLPFHRPVTPSATPLYQQIETDLRDLISGGRLAVGDTLPPEVELAEVYGVGRQTIRAALARLTAEGLLARQAGRGTTIIQRPERRMFFLDRSFTQQMAEMGYRARSQVLVTSSGVIDERSPEALRVCLGAPYLHLTRLRLAGDEPVGLQSAYIITQHCPGLERYDFNEASLYEVLSSAYRLIITRIKHTVTATTANMIQAQLLHVREGTALLVVNTLAFLESGALIESTTSHYRTDKYEYSTTYEMGEHAQSPLRANKAASKRGEGK